MSRRCSGIASTLISRAYPLLDLGPSDSPTITPEEIEVSRNSPMMDAPATMRRSVNDDERTADDRVVHGEHEDRKRHLPQHVEVAGEVVERGVADQHVADEQHHLRQEREGEQDGRDRADLGDHVVGAQQRSGEHQRQHLLPSIGAHHVGRDQRDEQQQRGRHADVLAVGDDLEAVEAGRE